MDYCIGIITYNRPKCVDNVIDDLLAQTSYPSDLIIVDDSEEKKTKNVVASKSEELRKRNINLQYISNSAKSNFGESRNLVMDRATSDILCFIDDDVRLPDEWMENIIKAHEKNPETAAIGGPAILVDDELENIIKINTKTENQNKFNKYGEIQDKSPYWIPPKAVNTQLFQGANMSFKLHKLEQIGGFDEGYKGTGFREEADVLIRLYKQGETLVYDPHIMLYHLQAQDGGTRDSDQNTAYWKGRNLIYFVRKNFNKHYKWALLRLFFYTDGTPMPAWKGIIADIIANNPEGLYQYVGYFKEIIEQ